MAETDKSLIRLRLENLGWVLGGLVLVAGIILIYHGGIGWFTDSPWSKITFAGWIGIAVILLLGLALQYGLIHLLRFRLLWHVFWLLPMIWLFNNGLIVIQRLTESEQGLALSGFIPLTDLAGWLLAVTYFPLLVAGGALAAIVDSYNLLPAQTCQYASDLAGAIGISNQDLLSWLNEYWDVFWDLLSDSFVRQVAPEYAGQRAFIDFTSSGVLALPEWFFRFGYTFSCLSV